MKESAVGTEQKMGIKKSILNENFKGKNNNQKKKIFVECID